MSGDSLSHRIAIFVFVASFCLPISLFAQGRLEGRVTRTNGAALSGVSVLINETTASTVTDIAGRYAFDGLPAGTYTVTFSLGTNIMTLADVRVDKTTIRLDPVFDWTVTFAESMTVYAASRRTERLFEAPASVAVIDEAAIARDASYAQLPRALVSTPGVELTQSGVFDFNVNIRGLNTSLNRRVLTLLDGRDAAGVLVGAQEWAAVAVPVDEVARVEVVRGPESALYGANAFNGVIDMTTKEPRYATGGNAQLAFGETGTRRFSVRQAGSLGRDWAYRVHGTYGRTDDFFTARTQSVEYPGLPREVTVPATDRTEFVNTGARVDRYFSADRLLTIDGGWARADGNVFVTGAGRPQNRGVQRPWFRSAFETPRWRASGYYDGRKGRMLSLSAGNVIVEDSMKLHGELQRRFEYGAGRGRVVAGGAFRYERADTRNDAGISTILRGIQDARSVAAYGQVDHNLTARLRVVLAGRLDDSTLHDTAFSPKAGLVQTISPTQRLRFTYGHAFQTASFVQYFTHVFAAPPVSLAALEASLSPALGGVALHLDNVPILALGNDRLRVERLDGFEAGYSGVFVGRVSVNADYYYNRVNDLVTALLPQVGTSLGRINPQFGAYEPPPGLSPSQRTLVLSTLRAVLPPSLFATMSNDLDGSPIFAIASYTNFGHVRVQGTEVSVDYFPNDRLRADTGFAWTDFATRRDFPDQPLSSNTPPYSARLGLSYADSTRTAAVTYRWSDQFTWIGGIFRGPVPSYSVADVAMSYKVVSRTRVSLNVTNLFNKRHYEIFGGDILRRTALVTLIQEW